MTARAAAEARQDLVARMARVPLSELESKIVPGAGRRLAGALASPGLSVVAEFKRLSPASGFRADVDLSTQLRAYERGGASAVSVATEISAFGGSIDDLQVARASTSLPVLGRDCIVDPYQLYEGAASGADAVILVAAILEPGELEALLREAGALGVDCLVEVRNRDEIEIALGLDACNLLLSGHDHDSGRIDTDLVTRLAHHVPTGATVVAEGGLSCGAEMEELDRIGVDAVLVGEALMRSPDPESAVRELLLD